MSTYLIGDIQGCLEPLERLLESVNFDPAEDFIWSCGDLVNRGGKSLGVLRLLYSIAPRVSVTLGNHDLHLLASQSAHPEGGCRKREFEKIITAPDCQQLIDWLSSQPLAVWSKEHRLLRVHAGVVPGWTRKNTVALATEVSKMLNSRHRDRFLVKMYGNRPQRWDPDMRGWRRLRTITNILTRLRFCDATGKANFNLTGPPSSAKKPMKPWFKHKHRRTRNVRVAFGHWAALGLRIKPRYLAMDSGYIWGGSLSAYRLEDGKVFQHKS